MISTLSALFILLASAASATNYTDAFTSSSGGGNAGAYTVTPGTGSYTVTPGTGTFSVAVATTVNIAGPVYSSQTVIVATGPAAASFLPVKLVNTSGSFYDATGSAGGSGGGPVYSTTTLSVATTGLIVISTGPGAASFIPMRASDGTSFISPALEGGNLATIVTNTNKIPSSPSQDRTTAAAPNSCRLSDGSAFYAGATEGTLSTLNGKVTACNTGAVTISAALPAGTNSIGSVNASQAGVNTVTPGSGTWSVAFTSGVLGVGTNNIGTVTGSSVVLQGSNGPMVTATGNSLNVNLTNTPSVNASQAGVNTVTPGSGTWSVAFTSGMILGMQTVTPGTGTWSVTPGTGVWSVAFTSGAITSLPANGSTYTVVGVGGAAVGVSLGNTTGKTEIHKVFTKPTAAASTAILGTYTVTTGKTLFVTHMEAVGVLQTISGTASKLGDVLLATPTGVNIGTMTFINPTTGDTSKWVRDFVEPMSVPSGAVIMSSVTPSAATGMNWIWQFDGYEK